LYSSAKFYYNRENSFEILQHYRGDQQQLYHQQRGAFNRPLSTLFYELQLKVFAKLRINSRDDARPYRTLVPKNQTLKKVRSGGL
jgi:hypothetical protein